MKNYLAEAVLPEEWCDTEFFLHEDDRVNEKFLRREIDRCRGSYLGDLRTGHQSLKDDLLRMAQVRECVRVVDAGCGTGRAVIEATEYLERLTGVPYAAVGVNAVDFRGESQCGRIRRLTHTGEVPYLLGRIEAIELPEESFDIVTCYEVLWMLEDEEAGQAIRNMASWLSEQGCLWMTIPPERRGRLPFQKALDLEGFTLTEEPRTRNSFLGPETNHIACLTRA